MAPPLHKAIQSPKRFADACKRYVESCLVKDDKGNDSDIIAIAGLAIALGCNRDQLARWKDRYGEPTAHDPHLDISRAIKEVEQAGEMQLQRMAVLGRNSMALALGKVKHGWIEQQHIKVDGKVSGSIEVVTGVPEPSSDDSAQ